MAVHTTYKNNKSTKIVFQPNKKVYLMMGFQLEYFIFNRQQSIYECETYIF